MSFGDPNNRLRPASPRASSPGVSASGRRACAG